ncbi:hypothetical protein D9X30_2723 [Cupriavidus sp. U2]|nr:hypothetical protein D9X30_2723 [Cupriavidus sp. U2]
MFRVSANEAELYGLNSLAWVWVLRRVQLVKIYPLVAPALLVVPIGSHFIFGERFQTQHIFGVILTSNA